MPRRGEYRGGFPAPSAPSRSSQAQRIGLRQAVALDTGRRPVTVTFDPSGYVCSQLAAELAEEWVELMEAASLSVSACRGFRKAMSSFCTYLDSVEPRSAEASLAAGEPDLHGAVTEWIRLLSAAYRAGSPSPAWLASRLRQLIARRIAHQGRPVAGHLHGWVKGALGVSKGQSAEVDEFSRADKKQIIQAAWSARRATEERIRKGRALAAAGRDPRVDGWEEPANLLWALAHRVWTGEDIAQRLPPYAQWPAPLRELLPPGILSQHTVNSLLRHLVGMLYPHNLDLHSYRILLMASTGRTSEEVVALHEDDIEYGPRSVLIDFTKQRARATRRSAFSTPADKEDRVLHPSSPRLDVAEVTRTLLALARPLAERSAIAPVPLFLRAAVSHHTMTVRSFSGHGSGLRLTDWLSIHKVRVDGPADIRRLRKSGKVEKAITFKGRISDIADDHTQETFRRSYAHGTTLRVIAGQVITTAQQHWLSKALTGPVVLDQEAEQSLQDPEVESALGLSAQDIEQLRAGELDMGVSSCRDPFASPFERPGQLCPVAPTRCLECRNAFILPSNLPQLLLFAAHLEQLRHRLTPRHFHALWGQSQANLTEVLRLRTDAEIARARRRIADEGLTLQLPITSQVEFDV
ncbi:hypothetical protein [Streptomyces sp. KR55]|uniref:hypothetical protein n=1 Tax=Streptomyces sp. KR55 TaxID=3457425 RepID=UPI003FD6176E